MLRICVRCMEMITLSFMLVLVSYIGSFGDEKIDKEYIKKNYPDVYRQIYDEGKKSAGWEAAVDVKTEKPAAEPVGASREPEKTVEAKKTADDPLKGAELGDWWNRSSLSYKPVPDHLLMHNEFTFSTTNMTGNNKGYTLDVRLNNYLRKHRFTNNLEVKLFNQSIDESTGDSIRKRYYYAQEDIQYDLTDMYHVNIGEIWVNNRIMYIDSRYVTYGGIGAYLINSPTHRLNLLVAYAHQYEKYGQYIKNMAHYDKDRLTGVYFREDFQWYLSEKVMLSQNFKIMQSMEDSFVSEITSAGPAIVGNTKRYILGGGVDLNFKLTQYLSLTVSTSLDYDSNPWPTVIRTDTSQTIGLKFNF